MRPVVGAARAPASSQPRPAPRPATRYVPCELNGEPGVLLHVGGGWAAVTVTVDDGLVTAVCIVVNPAKLERLVGE